MRVKDSRFVSFRSYLTVAALAALLPSVAACGMSSSASGDDTAERNEPIIDGTPASSHQEAALVNLLDATGAQFSACSGSVIAPRVVLTAGHCVDRVPRFEVIAPYTKSGRQTGASSRSTTYDWKNVPDGMVDPNKHDVGLILLDDPITLSKWPHVRKDPIPFGDQAVNIGRIDDGSYSQTELFIGKPTTVQDGSIVGYPFDYLSLQVIQPGDSGGPVEVPGTHHIIAVNSGAGRGSQVLARTDLVFDWIDDEVRAHGGWPKDDD